ncbi:MAG: DUF58 domain-containing protein [Saprospiraceae bacterium]|nr:DUF58 domain-containing protein [Saprospiraceae bacterium]MBK8112007.1 DUF58 domain-containing protein [Saprospiraceae bacterium]
MVTDTATLLRKVRKIEILAKGKSKEVFAGAYHSAFRGRGMTFRESREYQAGDDVRDIDWNVTARTNVPHVKQFEEEKELTVMLLIDTSASVFFGQADQKINYMAELSALLAYNTIREQNKLGALFFSDKVDLYLRPDKGSKAMLRVIREHITAQTGKGGNGIGAALQFLISTHRKRTLCFIISDFIQENYSDILNLASRRHDLIPIKIVDPLEKTLPSSGMIPLYDAEQNTFKWLDTGSIENKKNWAEYFEKYNQYYQLSLLKSGITGIELQNGSDYLPVLLNFFKNR